MSTTSLALPALSPDLLAGQLAASSVAQYRRDWAAYRRFCGDADPADPSSLARWRAHLAGETVLSPNSINRALAACKRIIKEAAAQGLLPAEVAARCSAVGGVKPLALKARLKPHARTRIAPAAMRRLCDSPDPTTLRGLRDRALLSTLAGSGVRLGELVALRTDSLLATPTGTLLTVRGKTDVTPRTAYLSAEGASRIAAWLAARPVPSPYLFTACAGRGARWTDRPLSAVGAWRIVTTTATACGLEHVHPHDFRRFVGTQLAAQDIRKAQRALGHKSIATTAAHYVLDELEAGLTDELY